MTGKKVSARKTLKCGNFANCRQETLNSEDFYQCRDCKEWFCYDCCHWGDEDGEICINCRLCDSCDQNAIEAKCVRIERCQGCCGKYCESCWGEGDEYYCGGCSQEKPLEDTR